MPLPAWIKRLLWNNEERRWRRRRKRRQDEDTELFVTRLEDRRLLSYTVALVDNEVTFTGDSAADLLTLSVGEGGYLRHNLALGDGIDSPTDLNPTPDVNDSRLVSGISGLVVNAGEGNDALVIDSSNGNPIPAGGISFDGGAGSDVLSIAGTGLSSTHRPDAAITGKGVVSVDGGTISFEGLASIDYEVAGGTFALDLPGADDVIDIANSTLTDGVTEAVQISGSSDGVTFETVRVRGSSIVIDTRTLPGTDTITVVSADNAHGNTSLGISTGNEAGDTVAVNGTTTFSGAVTINSRTINLNADITNAVAGSAGTVNVDTPGQIQDGIDTAAAGGTVNICPGTYDLTGSPSPHAGVDIGKALTLQATDYVDGTPDNTTTIMRGVDPVSIDLRITSPDVIVQGFTFDFNGPSGTRRDGGIEINGSPNLQNIHIIGNHFELVDGDPDFKFGNYAFRTGSTNDHRGLKINNNTFLANGDTGGFGIFLNPDSSAGTKEVKGSTFGGKLIQGIMVDKMHNVIIDGNILDTTLTSAAYNHPKIIGINAWGGAISNVTVSDNRIGTGGANMGGGVGITIGSSSVASTMTDVTVSGNTVQGTYVAGIQHRNADSTTYTHNILTDNPKGIEIIGTVSSVVIQENSIAGNTAGIDNQSGILVDAFANWWGDASGPYNATSNPTGTGNAVSENVDFALWIGKTDGDPDTATVEADIEPWLLQEIVDDASATGDRVLTTATSDAEVAGFIANVEALAPPAAPVTIQMNLGPGDYRGLNLDVPTDVRLLINLAGATLSGGSPALTVGSGQVVVANGTLTQSGAGADPGQGDFPTILVENNGTLTLGDATLSGVTINESDTYDQVAIRVDAGGSLAIESTVTNTINIVGAGRLIDYFDDDSLNVVAPTPVAVAVPTEP